MERIMKDESKSTEWQAPAATVAPGVPLVSDRATFQAELDKLPVREKALTREGDAIAAARRRLPMVEVDANLALIGPHGPLTLLEAFEGCRQLIAYYFMWHTGHPAAFETYWTTLRRVEAMDYSYALMDLTVYGRQEPWEDSPPGWPQQCSVTRTDGGSPAWPPVSEWPGGRPIAQWSRLEAGRSDDLGTTLR
jgi:predicted dithiol-disulfide oxidoreductase (DUF899 family)